MKRNGPYIGITGFMTLSEVVACHNVFYEEFKSDIPLVEIGDLKFMVGVLVSSKTLAGQTNRYPNRYPNIIGIAEILSLEHPLLLNTIHYNTDDPATLDEQIDTIMSLAPGQIHALQLNIRWANPVLLQMVKRKYRDLRLILQIGSGALDDVTEEEDIYIGDALRVYEGVADDYLVDPSGGKGQLFDVWRTFACLADKDIPRSIRPGVAGGRNADNIHELTGLMRRLGMVVNWDAEGKLRTPRLPDGGGDYLDLVQSKRYLKRSIALIARFGRSLS